jgi:hypothetical protein
MEEKEARRRPGVKVMGEETPEEKKESEKEQWRMMEELAKMMMYIDFMRSTISPCRWERAWARYVGKVWMEDTPVWEWGEGAGVYKLTIPYSRQEHRGESKIGPFHRWKGNLSKAILGGKQVVCKMMDKMNAYECMLIPLYTWRRMTTKVERLKMGGCPAGERNTKTNMKGTQHGGDFRAGQVPALYAGLIRRKPVLKPAAEARGGHEDTTACIGHDEWKRRRCEVANRKDTIRVEGSGI